MEIKCFKCNKKNFISDHFCHSCGTSLHYIGGKRISYGSIDSFLQTLPESDYYKNKIQKKLLFKKIFNIILALILFFGGIIVFEIILLIFH